MPVVAAYSMSIGAQQSIPYTATKLDGITPFDLTGYTLRFSLSRTLPANGVFVLQKDSTGAGVTIISPTAGTATINFLTADTLNLEIGLFYFDVVAISGSAEVPLTTGTFTLTDRVSR